MTSDLEIQTAFSATQIILVFLSVLFGLRYQQIKDITKGIIPNDKYELKSLEKKVNKMLWFDCTLLLTINIIVSVMFLPLFGQILANSIIFISNHGLDISNYNFTQTSFFLISLMIFGLLGWSILLINELRNFKIEKIEKNK